MASFVLEFLSAGPNYDYQILFMLMLVGVEVRT